MSSGANLAITTEAGEIASEIIIRRGLGSVLPERTDRRRVALLHQPGAPTRIAEAVRADLLRHGLDVRPIALPDRDLAKTWQTVASIHEQMAHHQIGRADSVVAVGGGACTDLAGFVAATWLRGIEAAYVPTTLLAAVDAAIGGKTGINLAGKNLVGAFAHPTRVSIDLDELDLLPQQLKREGWAEAIKVGFVGDLELVDIFREHGEGAPLEAVVPRAVAVKASVVSDDFRETGNRAVLNFGHTIGHGVEFAGSISHGEAVAIGMVAAAAASRRVFGFDSDLPELVGALGLPTATDVPGDQIRRLLELDKKRDAIGLRMVLLRAYADPVVEHVTDEVVDLALAAVAAS